MRPGWSARPTSSRTVTPSKVFDTFQTLSSAAFGEAVGRLACVVSALSLMVASSLARL